MSYLKLSTKNGWKPHVLCDFLDLKKHVMDKWMGLILPEKKFKSYSTFELLVLYTILHFYKVEVADIEMLLKVNWEKYLNTIVVNDLDELRTKIIFIDWEIKEVEFCNVDEKPYRKWMSKVVKMELLINEIMRCLLMKGLD